jgi:hypothetical protein
MGLIEDRGRLAELCLRRLSLFVALSLALALALFLARRGSATFGTFRRAWGA